MRNFRKRTGSLMLAILIVLSMASGVSAEVLSLSTNHNSSNELFNEPTVQPTRELEPTPNTAQDHVPVFMEERPMVIVPSESNNNMESNPLDNKEPVLPTMGERPSTTPMSTPPEVENPKGDNSASAVVVEQMEKTIKDIARNIEEFKVPLDTIFKNIRKVKLDILSLGTNISIEDMQKLNDRVAIIERYAETRDMLEKIMFTEPANAKAGTTLKSLVNDATALTGIREAAEEYLNTKFPTKYLSKVIADNRRYNPGQLSLKVITDAHVNLKTWIDSPSALVEVAKLVERLELADVEYIKNGGTVDPNNPTDPTDPNNPVDPSNPVDPENPGDLNTVTENDVKVFEAFKQSIAVDFKGVPVVTTMKLPKDYIARVAVREVSTNKQLADETTLGGEVKLAGITTATNIIVGFEVFKTSGTTVGASVGKSTSKLEVNDVTKPKLNYAYVIDGGLILNITDDSGLAEVNPILYRIEGEDNFKALDSNFGYGTTYGRNSKGDVFDDFGELFGKDKFDRYKRLDKNDYRIEVPTPTSVQVVAVDKFGNKLPIVIEIESDNTKITSTVPEYVEKLLKSTNTNTFNNKKYSDLIAVNNGTTVDILETFKKMILDEFRRFNSYDLVFSNQEGEIFNGSKVKFDKVGLHKITVTHRSEVGSVDVFVSVNEGVSNVKAYTVKTEVEVSNKTFKPIEALSAQTVATSKLNPGQLVALVDGKYVRMEEEVPFGDKTEKEIIIIDLNTGKEYTVKFKIGAGGIDDLFKPSETIPPATPPADIMNHWAKQNIITMINRGQLTGYPDGTFGPNNMITVRETLAIVGRVVKANPINAGQVQNQITTTGWGKEDVELALQRLPRDIFAGGYDRPIKREETAFVIANALKFQGTSSGVIPSDINTSPYANEISALVGQGVIKGFPNGTFKPNLEITRAEVSTILAKAPLK